MAPWADMCASASQPRRSSRCGQSVGSEYRLDSWLQYVLCAVGGGKDQSMGRAGTDSAAPHSPRTDSRQRVVTKASGANIWGVAGKH